MLPLSFLLKRPTCKILSIQGKRRNNCNGKKFVRNKKERWRDRGLEAKDAGMGKRSKITRYGDCDISEKVALGMTSTKLGIEVMYDERLFN